MTAENGNILQSGVENQPTINLNESHEQDYILLLIEREREIKELRQMLSDMKIDNSNKNTKIELLTAQNLALQKENSNLHAALEMERAKNKTSITPNIIPLTSDEEWNSTRPRTSSIKRKMKHPDPDIVARMKNNRKAFPAVCPKAMEFWQKLMDADLIDEKLKPTARCGVTVAARIICRMQTVVDPKITWSYFEKYWRMGHLQSNLRRESYKDCKMYAIVNSIFGLAADAPYFAKSVIAE